MELDIGGEKVGCRNSPELARTLREMGIDEWKCEQEAAADPEHRRLCVALALCSGRNADGTCGLKKIFPEVVTIETPENPPLQ